jgi:hypothetical protein
MEPIEPKSQLSLEESLRIFSSLSNVTDEPSIGDQTFQKSLLNIPLLLQAIRDVSGSMDSDSLAGWYRTNKPFDMAFNHASLALTTAGDALTALYSQVFLAKTLTSYAPLVLIRQACESALLSRWLIEDLTAAQILDRGFAIEWFNATESVRFSNNFINAGVVEHSAKDKVTSRARNRMEDVLKLGHKYRLLKQNKSDYQPIFTFSGFKDLFKDVNSNTAFNDMVWAYNLMSGVNHGLEWALMSVVDHRITKEYSTTNELGDKIPSGVVSHENLPRVESFTIPLHLALIQVSAAIANFKRAQMIKVN